MQRPEFSESKINSVGMSRMPAYTRVAPKLMTPILLCWPTTSEADVGDMVVEVETSRQ